MFTVVIPTYRRPNLVLDALDSVLGQSFQPKEIIVVESPSELMISSDLLAERVQLDTLANRRSSGAARNYGASKASQDYIAFLDDDDVWDPFFLENVARTIISEREAGVEPDLVFGHLFTDAGVSARSRHFPSLRSVFWVNPGITGSNIVTRRQSFSQLGGFDEGIAPSEDRDYVAKALLRGQKLVFAEKAHSTIRTVSDSRISTKFVKSNLRFIRRYWKSVNGLEKALMITLMAYKLAQIPKKRISSWLSFFSKKLFKRAR